MCYSIYMSTTSEEHLSSLNSETVRFERIPEDVPSNERPFVDLLNYAHRWYLVSRYGGCSCHYRHLYRSPDMDFGPPEDWSPEDEDDIESTQTAYDVFARILREGSRLDVLDVWTDSQVEDIESIEVQLSQIPRDSFRFFEGYRFLLV